MMNFVAAALTNYLVTAHFHDPETVHTQSIRPKPSCPASTGGWRRFGGPANAAFLIAIVAACGVWWILWRTPFGLRPVPRASTRGRQDRTHRHQRARAESFLLAGALSETFGLRELHHGLQALLRGRVHRRCRLHGQPVALLGQEPSRSGSCWPRCCSGPSRTGPW